jgi:hypothetical protein
MKLVMKAIDIDGAEYIVHDPCRDIGKEARLLLLRNYIEISAPKNRVAILFKEFIVSLFMDEVDESEEL